MNFSHPLSLIVSLFVCHYTHATVESAVLGAALGDALGRVTEFIDTTKAIKDRYGTDGISSFKDFKKEDWLTDKDGNRYAAYTDDTVMAKIVLEEALQARLTNQADQFAPKLAIRFIELFKRPYEADPLFDIRAHGPTNGKACKELASIYKSHSASLPNYWWDRNAPLYDRKKDTNVAKEGGCGSVMRAWPLGLIFHDNLELALELADQQSRITHRHPMARAACAALVTGIVESFKSSTHDDITPQMIVKKIVAVTEEYDHLESLYKTQAKKIGNDTELAAQKIAQDQLLTSDMIRYAAQAALEGKSPEEVLGTHNKKQANYRSPQGFLLGWSADEAIAAAIYVFLRHPSDLKAALQEAVNTPGDSDSIATLAGALVGAYIKSSEQQPVDTNGLENEVELLRLAKKASEALKTPTPRALAPIYQDTKRAGISPAQYSRFLRYVNFVPVEMKPGSFDK